MGDYPPITAIAFDHTIQQQVTAGYDDTEIPGDKISKVNFTQISSKSETEQEMLLRKARNQGSRINLKYDRIAEIKPENSNGEKNDIAELRKILDSQGARMKFEHRQSKFCKRYTCREHNDCHYYGRILLDLNAVTPYWALEVSGEHNNQNVKVPTHGIHPLFMKDVDALILQGLSPKMIISKLTQACEDDNRPDYAIPTRMQINTRKHTLLGKPDSSTLKNQIGMRKRKALADEESSRNNAANVLGSTHNNDQNHSGGLPGLQNSNAYANLTPLPYQSLHQFPGEGNENPVGSRPSEGHESGPAVSGVQDTMLSHMVPV